MRHMIIIIQRVLSPLKKNKPWTLLSSFLNDNIRWDSAKLQKQKFIYLQTAVTSETKSFFFFFFSLESSWCESRQQTQQGSFGGAFFLTQQTFPPPPPPRSLVQREQLNCIAQKLYIGLGNIKGGRKNRLRRTLHCNICKMYRKENKRNHTRTDESVVSFSSNNFLGTSTTCLYWTCALCTLRTAVRFLTESVNE